MSGVKYIKLSLKRPKSRFIFFALNDRKAMGFKILGISFDTKLNMYEAVVSIVGECGSRLKMLMRVRPFYTIRGLVGLYKCHIFSFIESGTPAYSHVAPSILWMLDRVQNEFLEVIGMSKSEALIHFNLALLNSRRDIPMLGVLHKVVLGVAPTPFQTLFKRSECDLRCHGFWNGISYHNKQLQDDVGRNIPVMLKRIVFGLVYVYNRLPQDVVNAENEQNLQRKL